MSLEIQFTETESIIKLEASVESVEDRGKSLYFTAIALTDDFVPVDVMKRDLWTAKGKEVRWRHITPETNVRALIGHVHEAYMENEQIKLVAEVWGYRKDLLKIQEQIKKNELSISLGYKKSVEKGAVVSAYFRELSLTPIPKCTAEMGCGIDSIITNEDKKDEKLMPENEQLLALLKESMSQNEKNTMNLSETIGTQNTERGESIVRLEATITAMEKRISDSNEIIAEQMEKIETLEENLTEANIKAEVKVTESLRLEIVELENISDDEAKIEEMAELMEFNEDQLLKMKERLLRTAKIAVQTSDNRQPPALGEQLQTNELDKLSPEQLAVKLNPNLQEMITQNQRSRKPAPLGANYEEGKDVPMIN